MKSCELREKLEKAQEKVEKCKATIERHQKQAEKKLQIVKDNGWENGLENDSCYRGDNYNYEALSSISDYHWKLDDIENATNKLKEAEQIVQNWKDKLDRQLEIEHTLITKVPDAFKQAREELVERWTKYDIAERDIMLQKKKELSYEDFRKLYKYTEEDSLKHTDEEFRKIEERNADIWLIDLYNRVYAITGEVTDCSSLWFRGKGLDGTVVGENGIAEVNTIGAGGYNIQRFHLRVLVNDITPTISKHR